MVEPKRYVPYISRVRNNGKWETGASMVEVKRYSMQIIGAAHAPEIDPWPDTHGSWVSGADFDATVATLSREVERLRELLNTPELHDFAKAVVLEAAHQRERWGSEHDAGKDPADWFWLLGYLGGKALRAHIDGDAEKALHHTISSAAVLANWHAAISGNHTAMRPGIEPPVAEACGRKW